MSKLDQKIQSLRDEKVSLQGQLSAELSNIPSDTAKKIQGIVNRISIKAGAIGELSAIQHLANWSRVEDDIDPDND